MTRMPPLPRHPRLVSAAALLLASAAAIVFSVATASAQAAKVTGTFTVDGKTTTWKQVYVSRHEEVDSPSSHFLVVLLASAPVSDADRTPERLRALVATGALRAMRIVWKEGIDGFTTTPFHPDASDSGTPTRFGAAMDLTRYDGTRLGAQFKSRMVGQNWQFNAFVEAQVAEGPPMEADPEPAAPTTADPARTNAPTDIKKTLGARGYEWNEDNFHHAVMEDDADAVKLFIKGGMSPDLKVDGSPVLTSAAMFGKVKAALALIAAGANPNASDGACTPIIRAASRGPVELIEALIKAGADVNAKAAGGGTALMLAQIMNRDDVVALLKKAGAK